MSKLSGVSLKDFCRALEFCALSSGYGDLKYGPTTGGGSAYTFRLFEKKDDAVPCVIFAVHPKHGKKKELYRSDLRKVWDKTAITEEVFMGTLKNL